MMPPTKFKPKLGTRSKPRPTLHKRPVRKLTRTRSSVAQNEVANPISAYDLTDDFEQDALTEIRLMIEAFAERASGGQPVRDVIADSTHYILLVFRTRDQKESFLRLIGWIKHGDKYLNGEWIARFHRLDLPDIPRLYRPRERVSGISLTTTPSNVITEEREKMTRAERLASGKEDSSYGEREGFEIVKDDEYWISISFRTSRQLNAFLDMTGWGDNGRFILNGEEIARRYQLAVSDLNIPIKLHVQRRRDAKLLALT